MPLARKKSFLSTGNSPNIAASERSSTAITTTGLLFHIVEQHFSLEKDSHEDVKVIVLGSNLLKELLVVSGTLNVEE